MKITSLADWPAIASYLTVILLAVSTALPILLPIPPIPKPSGDYKVGTTSFVLTDTTRKELYSGRDEPRKFMTQIWYPANPRPSDPKAPWMDHAGIYGHALSNFLHKPTFFLDHLALVKTPAYQDAPIAKSNDGYPIIVFSHGWKGFSAQNTGQAIELASHGYVVVGIQHTYGAIVTVFPDGTIAPNNPNALPDGVPEDEYDLAARKLVDQWASDIAFALDYLAIRNSDIRGSYFSAFDLNRLGVYGHSTGGGAAIEFCGRDTRCKALLGMDPFMTPVSPEVLNKGTTMPSFYMFSQVWADDTNSKNNRLFDQYYNHLTPSTPVVFIEGTKHYDFSDLPLLSPIAPQLGLKGPINGNRMVKIADTYLLAFFESALKGQPTNLFDGSSPEFPEVRFLK
jgi:predicted dienelactone hydrolase